MNRRRKMFSVFLCGFAVLIFAMASWDGAYMRTEYNVSNDVYDEEKKIMSETEFQLIGAGIQSASSHNMQPWKIKILDQMTFALYADMEKTLPMIDPENNQLLMSQGTFIGSVKQVAEELGVSLDVKYAPISLNEKLPLIATFTILSEEKIKADAISSASIGMNTQEAMLDTKKVSDLLRDRLNDYEMIWVKEEQKPIFQEYLRKGNMVESKHQGAMTELLEIFRFTKWDKNKYRYGLSLNTITPPLNMCIEPIVGLTSNPKSFGKSSLAAFEKRLENEEAYLVLAHQAPKPSDYVRVGEALSILGLCVEGYTVRPAVQLIEPLEGMQELYNDLREEYAIQGEVLQIIGFTRKSSSYHESVRHQVLDLIIE
ncbi:MAG: hypothetical protein PHG19_08310 [Anaerotignum sp.]|nr:hypothetical protein [Anaerotignum sp.]